MKIEKLTENKIRFILNLKDLEENNIDYHSFMANSIETQDIFLDMLDKAEKEIGFITKNYKLMLEVIATSDGNFILTVTRISPEIEKNNIKKIQIKRKLNNPMKPLAIYKFDSFDCFCDFCIYLKTSPLKNLIPKLKKSRLYKYKNFYYLVLQNISFSLENLKSLHITITEFAFFENNTDLFERKLIEYGKIIIKNDAISTCSKHFASK